MTYEYSHSYEMYEFLAKQKCERGIIGVETHKANPNDEMIERLRKRRISDPSGYARLRITICYENCISKAGEIRKKGKTPRLTEDFKLLLNNLKTTIKNAEKNFGFDKNDFRNLCEENGWSYKLTFNLNPGA